MYFFLHLTEQKMKFSIKDFFSKYDQIRNFLWIWSHLLNKSLTENFIFCAVPVSWFFFFWNAKCPYIFWWILLFLHARKTEYILPKCFTDFLRNSRSHFSEIVIVSLKLGDSHHKYLMTLFKCWKRFIQLISFIVIRWVKFSL